MGSEMCIRDSLPTVPELKIEPVSGLTPELLKQEIIDKVLIEGDSQGSVSIDYALPNMRTLPNWIAQYKKNGYIIVEKQRGRPSKMGGKPKKTPEEMTELEHVLEENEHLRAEVAYLKKLRELRLREKSYSAQGGDC